MTRIAVFIDYQNIYHGARRAFPDPRSDAPSFGHVDPVALARLLTGLGRAVNPDRILSSTSVYRGEPGRMSHPQRDGVTVLRPSSTAATVVEAAGVVSGME